MPQNPNIGRWSMDPDDYPERPDDDSDEPAGQYTPPVLELTTMEGDFRLTAQNSLVRTYQVGDGEFDHVVHLDPISGKTLVVFFVQEGFPDDFSLLEHFTSRGYQVRTYDELDDEAIELYSRMMARGLDDPIGPDSFE